MPIKMTKETKSLITIISIGLTVDLWKFLSLSTAFNAVQTFASTNRRLRPNFKRF